MTAFDSIKALQEELVGLASVQGSMRRRELTAEEAMGRAEVELNDLRKLKSFLTIEMERMRAMLNKLIEEKAR